MVWKRVLAATLLLAGSVSFSHAQNWPTRPIEVIVPFPAGGSVDVIARAVARALSEKLNQQFVVSNRVGASGTVAFNALASAPPDGYLLAAGPTTPIANAPYLMKGVRYNAESFDYICHVFENHFTMTVAPDSRFKSIKQLLDEAKANPGKISYGHSGNGTIPHLSVANLGDALGIKFEPVPFRGESAVMPILLKGDIDFASAAVVTVKGQAFRPLAVFSGERHPALPDVPSVRELGLKTMVPPGHNGIFAPKGLPPDVRKTLESACAEVLKGPIVQRVMTNTGQVARYLNGSDFHTLTAADYKFKGELIRRLGLTAE